MREQHQARRGALAIELADESIQHLGRRQGFVGLREIGPVAPVLEGAEEEDLDAELPGLLVDGEDIRLFDALRVDVLARRDGREGGKPVPEARRRLELHLVGRHLHLLLQQLLHRLALAREEVLGLVDQLCIARIADLMRTGSGAALDLEQETRPVAVVEIAVGAGAQQEGALQRVDGAPDRAGAGERPVIIAGAVPRAPVLGELRRPVPFGHQDVREGFVVPHQHVVARAQLLDEVGLEQQRLGLGRRGDEFHAFRLGDHAGDAVGMTEAARIARDALLEAAGLADIEHIAAIADHAVDAGGIGQRLPGCAHHFDAAPDRSLVCRQRLRLDLDRADRLDDIVVERFFRRQFARGDSAGHARVELCASLWLLQA